MSDPETERAIGRLEGRFDAVETRIGDMMTNVLDRLSAHDQNSREGIAALRQDVVHANTEHRVRMEAGFEKISERLDNHGTAIGILKDKNARAAGAGEVRSRTLDLVIKLVPYISGLVAVCAFLMAMFKK